LLKGRFRPGNPFTGKAKAGSRGMKALDKRFDIKKTYILQYLLNCFEG
jgi:hypothetical protein